MKSSGTFEIMINIKIKSEGIARISNVILCHFSLSFVRMNIVARNCARKSITPCYAIGILNSKGDQFKVTNMI